MDTYGTILGTSKSDCLFPAPLSNSHKVSIPKRIALPGCGDACEAPTRKQPTLCAALASLEQRLEQLPLRDGTELAKTLARLARGGTVGQALLKRLAVKALELRNLGHLGLEKRGLGRSRNGQVLVDLLWGLVLPEALVGLRGTICRHKHS